MVESGLGFKKRVKSNDAKRVNKVTKVVQPNSMAFFCHQMVKPGATQFSSKVKSQIETQ